MAALEEEAFPVSFANQYINLGYVPDCCDVVTTPDFRSAEQAKHWTRCQLGRGNHCVQNSSKNVELLKLVAKKEYGLERKREKGSSV